MLFSFVIADDDDDDDNNNYYYYNMKYQSDAPRLPESNTNETM
jgi:hypothetical protein